jgi:hypothetical protein
VSTLDFGVVRNLVQVSFSDTAFLEPRVVGKGELVCRIESRLMLGRRPRLAHNVWSLASGKAFTVSCVSR